MTIFVNRGVTMNLMNAFPKPFFVKDVCPGSDQNMNYMSDSIAFIYLRAYSFIHLACIQPYHSLSSMVGGVRNIFRHNHCLR